MFLIPRQFLWYFYLSCILLSSTVWGKNAKFQRSLKHFSIIKNKSETGKSSSPLILDNCIDWQEWIRLRFSFFIVLKISLVALASVLFLYCLSQWLSKQFTKMYFGSKNGFFAWRFSNIGILLWRPITTVITLLMTLTFMWVWTEDSVRWKLWWSTPRTPLCGQGDSPLCSLCGH